MLFCWVTELTCFDTCIFVCEALVMQRWQFDAPVCDMCIVACVVMLMGSSYGNSYAQQYDVCDNYRVSSFY